MKSELRQKLTVAAMVIVVSVFLGLVAWRGLLMIMSGSAIGVVLGVAVVGLVLVGVWVVVRSVMQALDHRRNEDQYEASPDEGAPSDRHRP